MVSIQNEIGTRSGHDTDFHNLRQLRDTQASIAVNTGIFLSGPPGVQKHLKNEIHV